MQSQIEGTLESVLAVDLQKLNSFKSTYKECNNWRNENIKKRATADDTLVLNVIAVIFTTWRKLRERGLRWCYCRR